jgi:hypothetical protein
VAAVETEMLVVPLAQVAQVAVELVVKMAEMNFL